VIRVFTRIVGLLALLAPVVAHAQQTNLDQGKSASQLFSATCAECHKAGHALGKGKSTDQIAGFLREHYTTSREQAAALAAYVSGGRDTVANPSPGKKPPVDRAASTEEPKPDKHNPAKPQKPDDTGTANTKPPRHPEPEVKPAEETSHGIPGFFTSPATRTEGTPHDKPANVRNRRKEPATPTEEKSQEPAAVAHAPASPETPAATPEMPKAERAPAAANAPAEPSSGETSEPVPRDNVPD